MDISKYDFQFQKIKELSENAKEKNRKAIRQEGILKLAIQDRILGTINDEELENIAKESDHISGKCGSARIRLYEWCMTLSNIREELMHLVNNAGYATAELDAMVNIARIFSGIKKNTKEE